MSCSKTLIENIKNDIPNLLKIGAYKADLTNITGDDMVISAFVPDEKLATVNKGIVDILRKNAEDLGDINGISSTPEGASEGVSYAELESTR